MASNLEDVFKQLQGFNPQAKNRWDSFQYAYSPTQELGAVNQYTDLARKNAIKTGAGNVASARKSAANRLGNYGGSIAETAISGAGENAAADTSNILSNIDLQRLGLLPGLMETANKNTFNVTNAAQGVDMQNIINVLQKLKLSGDMGNEIDTQPGLLSDIFSGLGLGAKALSIPTGANKFLFNNIFG